MFRIHAGLPAFLAAAGLLTPGGARSIAADAPYAGTWKVTINLPAQSVDMWLLRIEQKDGKPAATMLSTSDAKLQDSKVEQITADDKSVHFTVHTRVVDFPVAVYFPKDDAKQKKLLGSVPANSQRWFVEMERSDLTKLDARESSRDNPGVQDAREASQIRDPKRRAAAFKELLEKYPEGMLAFFARLDLLGMTTSAGTPDTDLRGDADQLIKLAAPYGPEMKLHALQMVTQMFMSTGKLDALGLYYAQEAAKTLDANTPALQQAAVLKSLRSALKKNGKVDEARALRDRIAKLDAELDEEFARSAVPFTPEPAKARKGEGNRVLLVELFTGVMCPPCVAADVAFDALLQSHKPADVVLLQYHMPIPGPDPLTNRSAETRFKFYDLEGTPSVVLNGKPILQARIGQDGRPTGPVFGGLKQGGKESYQNLVQALDGQLESKPGAHISLSAKQEADTINIHADVTDVSRPGDSVRLRLVLVEDVVHFAGSNGQRLHHHVVRAFPGGVDGLALKQASAQRDARVNISELQKSLNEYLAGEKFDEDSRPLELKRLKVVAFVQDDATKEVLQAAQVDVGGSHPQTK